MYLTYIMFFSLSASSSGMEDSNNFANPVCMEFLGFQI